MPKHLPIVILSSLAMILAAVLLMRARHEDWTSESAGAIAELERGLEAQRRYYPSEAIEHFGNALELDSEFAVAKIFLLQSTRFDKYEHWDDQLEELRGLSTAALTPRERFLVRYGIATLDEERSEADRILETYLREHPDDAFGLEIRCDRLWRSDHADKAELCYTDLLKAEPNWVQAENRLGYLAMSQGRFQEAEEHFRTYRYIAPDQANPHDSLGELLILLGRYDEARAELGEALSIRPDFCNSYRNLAAMVLYTSQASGANEIVERAAEHCGDEFATQLGCIVEFNLAFVEEEWEWLATSAAKACVRRDPGLLWMVHRGTVMIGELRLARKIEKAVSEIKYKMPTATQLHLKGVRLCAEGKAKGASSSFEGADRQLGYQSLQTGMLKLFNRLNWAHALELRDDSEEAEKLVASVAEVNPDLANRYRRGEIVMPRP